MLRFSKHGVLIYLILLAFWGLVFLGGCRKLSPQEERGRRACQYMVKKGLPPSSQHRAEVALSKWENGVLDPQPILVDALLATPKGQNTPLILLVISDEDSDITGMGVREDHHKSGGQTDTIVETYPVYDSHSPSAVSYELVPVKIRNSGEHKDEALWKHYAVSAEPPSPETLPPVLVSVPEPNKVDVSIWVYDRAGHKSGPIALRNIYETQR